MANEIVQQTPSFSVALTEKLDLVQEALPKDFNKTRFVQNALALLNDNPSLQKYGQPQLMAGLLKGAYLGLDFYNKECYLVPYGSQLNYQTDYRGAKKLCKKYSIRPIKDIYAKLVRECDEFEEAIVDGELKINFRPKPFSNGSVVGAFAVVIFTDGGMMCETMSIDELETTRRQSKASNSPAWKNFPGEMYKKGLAIDTPILTPNGYVAMENISVGDVVFDMDGKKAKVTDVSEIKKIKCFEVIFSDGERLVCDDEHRWVAKIGSHAYCRDWETYTVNELLEAKKSGLGISIPVCKPVEFDKKELVVPPYILGYWIGNGSRCHAKVSCDKRDSDEICELIQKSSNGKYEIGARRVKNGTNSADIGIKNGLLNDLRNIGVLNNKHIPKDYLTSSYEQRLELLKGLMDSDGTLTKDRGRAIFSTVRCELANKVHQLVSSLGEKAIISSRLQKGFMKEVVCYYVSWQPTVCPVSLKRKVDKFRPRKLCVYRSVKEINEIDSVPTKCIAVDSPTKTYLAGYGCIPTHNTVLHRLCKHIELDFENPTQQTMFMAGMEIETDTKAVVENDIANNANTIVFEE